MAALRFSEKPSDLQVSVHPIVVLSISDHLARHALRRPGPNTGATAGSDAGSDSIVAPLLGMLLGSQDGRRVTIQRTFGLSVEPDAAGVYTVQDEVLEFCETIESGLSPVGYYLILPKSGPDARLHAVHHMLVHRFRMHDFLVLGFDPAHQASAGASLPITLYETQLVTPADAGASTHCALLEVPQYSVSTDPAEMIGMDSVARGGGNAQAIAAEPIAATAPTDPTDPAAALSRDEQDAIAALRTKANAVRMLHARIDLLAAYLAQLSTPAAADTSASAPHDHALLRDILAAVVQLGLVAPADSAGLAAELAAEDHALQAVTLLNETLEAAAGARAANRKFVVAGSAAAAMGLGLGRTGLMHSLHAGRMDFPGEAAGAAGGATTAAAMVMQRRQMLAKARGQD